MHHDIAEQRGGRAIEGELVERVGHAIPPRQRTAYVGGNTNGSSRIAASRSPSSHSFDAARTCLAASIGTVGPETFAGCSGSTRDPPHETHAAHIAIATFMGGMLRQPAGDRN